MLVIKQTGRAGAYSASS